MISKEDYEKGLRCNGVCSWCSESTSCYQGIQILNNYVVISEIFDLNN